MMKDRRRRLQIGRAIIVVVSLFFMMFSVVAPLNPLQGEEEFVGLTFRELQSLNPRLADSVWHDTVGFATIVFGVNLLIVILAWRELPAGSRLAWYSILILILTFTLAVLAAHVPLWIRYPGYADGVPPFFLALVQLVGLAVTAKPVFSMRQGE